MLRSLNPKALSSTLKKGFNSLSIFTQPIKINNKTSFFEMMTSSKILRGNFVKFIFLFQRKIMSLITNFCLIQIKVCFKTLI